MALRIKIPYCKYRLWSGLKKLLCSLLQSTCEGSCRTLPSKHAIELLTCGFAVAHSASSYEPFTLATVFVDGFTFYKPSTVGDRVVFRAQCSRVFGSVLEVEVSINK